MINRVKCYKPYQTKTW